MGDYLPADAVQRLGAALGSAIRKMVLRLHLLAPSIEGQSVDVIEELLRDHEGEILSQLRLMTDTFKAWKEQSLQSQDRVTLVDEIASRLP